MQFCLLGPLVVLDGATERPVSGSKLRGLLAVLLLHANQELAPGTLRQHLWGDNAPDSADASLRNLIARLRRALGDEAGSRLRTSPGGYLLRVTEGELDLQVFADRCKQGRQLLEKSEWAGAGDVLASALSLWRGDPFSGIPDGPELLHAQDQWLRETRLLAQEGRIEADLQLGRDQELIAEIRALADAHPLREGLHAQLMLALHRAGRQAEALEVFQVLRRRLVDELGVEPGPLVRQAQREVLDAEESAGSTEPSSGTAKPARAAVPRQLPIDIPDFTGRESHLRRLRAALAATGDGGTVAVSAISGTGGMGKTTLAVHAAHLLAGDFPDGQLFISLRGAGTEPVPPADALATALHSLGVAADAVPSDIDARSARYRTLVADQRLLIVLDDARDSAQVRPLLPGTGRSAVLVTSRSRLPSLVGIDRLDIEALDDAQARALFAGIVGSARADAEPEATADLLRCCAGLPLAVRIAGARLANRPAWTIADLAERLTDEYRRLDQLRVEDTAVRASIEVSYRSLPSGAASGEGSPARAFRLLGLAGGPDISLPAAAALLGEPLAVAERTLAYLVDNCLLDCVLPGRYRLHDLLRVFAAECALREEPEELRREALGRLAHWYLGTLAAADRLLVPKIRRPELAPPDPGHQPLAFDSFSAALQWCDEERANLVAMTEQAVTHGLPESAVLLASFSWGYFRLVARHREWQASNTAGIASAQLLGDREAEARLLNSQAALLYQTNRPDEAESCLVALLAIRRELDDAVGELSVLTNLAILYIDHPEKVALSVELGLQALDLARALDRPMAVTNVQNNLGSAMERLGNFTEALGWYHASLASAIEIADHDGVAISTANVGAAHLHAKEFDQAEEFLLRALPLTRAVGNRITEAEILGNLGRLRTATGPAEEARGHLERARELWQAMDDPQQAEEIRILIDALDALDDTDNPVTSGEERG
ncbi:BTAD domain-containing putative transcriptional regulator [Streptacidiphilus sp. N1-12]|uniref:BTAD domain-containing putative transcriptional regulator n=2 Tax=Streptacidiphilus alkalitolerans TaxID=3342712 RepID=A0ABV6WQQ2_9ACTN